MLKPLALAAALAFAVLATGAGAQDAPTARVVATRTPDGVTVRYHLSAPTARVVFGDQDTIRERWSVITPGLTLAGARSPPTGHSTPSRSASCPTPPRSIASTWASAAPERAASSMARG